jgi:hypothetical protein
VPLIHAASGAAAPSPEKIEAGRTGLRHQPAAQQLRCRVVRAGDHRATVSMMPVRAISIASAGNRSNADIPRGRASVIGRRVTF